MRVVMSAFGSRGDTQPFITLGTELLRRGHGVVLCGYGDFAESAEAAGVPYMPCEHGAAESLLRDGGMDALTGRTMMKKGDYRDLVQRVADMTRAQFRCLAGLTPGADLVLATGVNMAWRSTAEAAGVPGRFVGFAPTLFTSAQRAAWPLPRPTPGRRLSTLAWWGYGPVTSPNDERASLGLPPVRWSFSDVVGLDMCPVLAADEELAPLPPELCGKVVQVPAIVETGAADLPPELEAFLEAGDPPVYLGFGRMPSRHPARTARDMLAAARALRLRSVVLRGWAGLVPEDAADVFVVGEAPHAPLFRRCAAVVHHGGAGTTAQACRAGVPQVVVPHVTDQHFWAARVRSQRIGVTLALRDLTARTLRERLQRVLADERCRFRAQVMAERLRLRDGVTEAADATLA